MIWMGGGGGGEGYLGWSCQKEGKEIDQGGGVWIL